MGQNNSGLPHLTAGRNIVVETVTGGYRISARPNAPNIYRGFFQVRPYPEYSAGGSARQIQIVNGSLPYERAADEPAGHVSIDRLHLIPEEKGGGIGSRRMRFPIPPKSSLTLPDGNSVVFLKVTAHSGGGAERKKFSDGNNRTVYFTYDYLTLLEGEEPELKEGVIYFPLAEAECDGTGYSLTQLNSGEPSGVIMQYYGSDTLEDSDSGSESGFDSDSESLSSSGSESDNASSSSDESSSSDVESSSTDSSSTAEESSSSLPDTSSSGGDDESDSGGSFDSDGEPDSESNDEDSDDSESSDDGGGDDSESNGGNWSYDPNLWYIVADCTRHLFHPSLGENFSGTINYYAAKGDKIVFDPEPEPPTPSKPYVEWLGVVMIEGPFLDRLDIPQSRIEELNRNSLGEPC